jgi:16S rRNA (adenine1518-N6/adenine1519-N6)-dimethyltransferase
MQTLTEIRDLLDAHNLSPRKSLGQNFLVDHNLIKSLVDHARVGAGDLVLEIGPGTGTLTDELLDRGCEVIACEIDRGLAALNRERLAGRNAFTLVEGDCLASKHAISDDILAAIGDRPFTLVANLPYGAATPVLVALLVDHPRCAAMHITIQREVAQRLVAKPGSKQYGTISVIAGALASAHTIAKLPPECFWPRPDVTSAMVSITRLPEPLTDRPKELGELCTRLFGQRRKQLGTVLGRETVWPDGITPSMRAEQLDPGQIVALLNTVGVA